MKVPFVHGPGDLRMDDIDRPRAGPGDVVVRVAQVGICGSDLGYVAVGGVAGPAGIPIPLGHELSGVVEEVGDGVTGVAPGDRVIVNPYFNGIGNGGPEGGFADLLLVRDVQGQPQSLIAMPDSMSFETGALIEPLSVSMHGVNRSQARAGDKVCVFGAGPIGLGIVAALRSRGVTDIVVFDLSALRRERAMQLGARAAFDPRDNPPAEMLGDLHGRQEIFGLPAVGTDVYIEASGGPGVINGIVDHARHGARLTVVAVQKKPITLDFQTMLAREITITMAMGYPDEVEQVFAMLESGAVDVSPMITHRFDGEDFMDAFRMASRSDEAVKILVRYDRS